MLFTTIFFGLIQPKLTKYDPISRLSKPDDPLIADIKRNMDSQADLKLCANLLRTVPVRVAYLETDLVHITKRSPGP